MTDSVEPISIDDYDDMDFSDVPDDFHEEDLFFNCNEENQEEEESNDLIKKIDSIASFETNEVDGRKNIDKNEEEDPQEKTKPRKRRHRPCIGDFPADDDVLAAAYMGPDTYLGQGPDAYLGPESTKDQKISDMSSYGCLNANNGVTPCDLAELHGQYNSSLKQLCASMARTELSRHHVHRFKQQQQLQKQEEERRRQRQIMAQREKQSIMENSRRSLQVDGFLSGTRPTLTSGLNQSRAMLNTYLKQMKPAIGIQNSFDNYQY